MSPFSAFSAARPCALDAQSERMVLAALQFMD